MARIISLLLVLMASCTHARTVSERDLPAYARDYQIINPFLSCGPGDGCVELPDVPYAWRFVPTLMGYRKFTPVGAIRKDWNDYWLAKRRVWWDYTYDLPDWRWRYNGWNLYNNSVDQW